MEIVHPEYNFLSRSTDLESQPRIEADTPLPMDYSSIVAMEITFNNGICNHVAAHKEETPGMDCGGSV